MAAENNPLGLDVASAARDGSVQSNGPVALITGITGQDGSYLTELLLDKGAYCPNSLLLRQAHASCIVPLPAVDSHFVVSGGRKEGGEGGGGGGEMQLRGRLRKARG